MSTITAPSQADARAIGADSPAVRAVDVRRSIGGRTVIDGLTLDLDRGCLFGLLGPNGAGKTTTVRLLTGLIPADSGRIELLGRAVTRQSAPMLRARVGVQSDYSLYGELTLRENLSFWGDLMGMERDAVRSRSEELAGLLDLEDRLDSPVGELSKGMTLKAVLARTLLASPEVLFLDEPTAGLDPEAAEGLLAHLRHLADAGTTVLVCTHQLHGFEGVCDRVGILRRGRLVAQGSVDDLVARRWPTTVVDVTTPDPAAALSVAGPGASATGDVVHVPITPGADGTVGDLTARLVSDLALAGVRLHSVVPRTHSLKDLYFATIQEQES